MTIRTLLTLAALDPRRLRVVLERLPATPRRGRPWSCSRIKRVLIASAALRSNLTMRELAAVLAMSKSTVHRIVATITPQLAALLVDPPLDRRWSWVVDGSLIPTRDHRRAARSKNYRWSTNAQVLIRRRDRRVIAVSAGGPGNRNDPVHYRGSLVESLCQQHGPCLPMVAIAESQSSSPPSSVGAASSAIARGDPIGDGAHVSSTSSRA